MSSPSIGICMIEPRQHLWYNQQVRTFKPDNKLGSKTKLLWQNPEYRQHMIDVHKGQKSWNKGLKIQTNTGKTHFKKGEHLNEAHPQWKGDNVGYFSLHNWIFRKLGKASKCVNGHIAKRYYWGNISGEYKRDFSDWHELCWYCNHNDGIRIPERFKI